MKRGIVVAGRGSQVRVQFDDADGMISPWLDVAQTATIGKQTFNRFQTGELVRCYIDDKGETGEALFAIYNDQAAPPADGDDVIHIVMPDGSSVAWAAGSLTVDHASGVSATFGGGKLVLDGDLEVTGALKVDGQSTLADTTINGVPQVGS